MKLCTLLAKRAPPQSLRTRNKRMSLVPHSALPTLEPAAVAQAQI